MQRDRCDGKVAPVTHRALFLILWKTGNNIVYTRTHNNYANTKLHTICEMLHEKGP